MCKTGPKFLYDTADLFKLQDVIGLDDDKMFEEVILKQKSEKDKEKRIKNQPGND